MSKRGVAPLVATIFLIAVFIAVGAVLMNIGTGLVSADSCGDIAVALVEEEVCFDGEALHVGLRNEGSTQISALDTTISGSAGEKESRTTLSLAPGERATTLVAYDGDISTVTMTAVARDQACSSTRIRVAGIPRCR